MTYLRTARYRPDLWLATQKLPLVLTVHNLVPHNRAGEHLVHSNYQYTIDRAQALFVHSAPALDLLDTTYRIARSKCHFIPHGDLTVGLGPPPSKFEARTTIGVEQNERMCLMLGTAQPYKGIEPVISWWRANAPPAKLFIVGRPLSPEYARHLISLAADNSNISLHLQWQHPEIHVAWLSAADCVLFHHTTILTSGAACEARSLGLPILIPERHKSIDLGEPHPLVLRFASLETNFGTQLANALASRPNYDAAREWREYTNWSNIARDTARVYRLVLGE